MCDNAKELDALRKENLRLRHIIGALMHGYTTLCEGNIRTGEIKLMQLGDTVFSRIGLSNELTTWDGLTERYVECGVYPDDQLKVRRLLSRPYLREHLHYGEGITREYRNELGVYGELRIVRIDEETILAGFTEKDAEITERFNNIYLDSLTQVKNRKFYDEQLAAKICQALVMADVDCFKGVNDAYGHACGDEALAAVAATLRASVRDEDDVVRYGGDEFFIVFRHIDAQTLPERIETMRRAVECIRLKDYPKVRLTMSFGVTYGLEQVKTMLAAADALLYESKQKRNKVTIREFPCRDEKQEEYDDSPSDGTPETAPAGADAAPAEWAGYRVSRSPRRCPYCNRQTEGYVFTDACESEGVRAVLYWCHECQKPYAVPVRNKS